jgi:hypothetical protein
VRCRADGGTVPGMDRARTTAPAPRDGWPGEPDRRALAAMANASRRARRSADGVVPPSEESVTDGIDETGSRKLVARTTSAGRRQHVVRQSTASPPTASPSSPMAPPPLPPPPMPPPVRRAGRRSLGRPRGRTDFASRWGLDDHRTRALLAAALGAVVVLAAVGIGLGVGLRSPANPASSRLGAAHRPSASHRGTAGGSGSNASATSPPSTAPAPAAAPATPGGPRIASVSPDAGAAGQTVVVDGSGLFSSDGQVDAYFNGSAAGTSCTSQTSCTVTVPDLGSGPATVNLTVVTASGRSNALRFSYR